MAGGDGPSCFLFLCRLLLSLCRLQLSCVVRHPLSAELELNLLHVRVSQIRLSGFCRVAGLDWLGGGRWKEMVGEHGNRGRMAVGGRKP